VTEVNLSINGASYDVVCEPGQEERLQELAARIDGKIADITARSGQGGQSRMLLMAALMIIDEIEESKATASAHDGEQVFDQAQDYLASVFEQVADRVQKITDKL
jgi:cell division protein ZapA